MDKLTFRAAVAAAALHMCSASASSATPVSITINPTVVANVSAQYVSFNLDYHLDGEEYPAWVGCGVLNMSLLNDTDLVYLAGQLSASAPSHLRVGGSEGDEVFYALNGAECPFNTTFCLTEDRWNEINAFSKATNSTLLYGLNAMAGRANCSGVDSDEAPGQLQSAYGATSSKPVPWCYNTPWDGTNAAQLLAYTAAQIEADPNGNFSNLFAFEFGNEKQGTINASVYAADVANLWTMVDKYWHGSPSKPNLVSNDENPDSSYWDTLLATAYPEDARGDAGKAGAHGTVGTAGRALTTGTASTGSQALAAVPGAGEYLHAATWHLYIGYGLDPELPTKAWNASFLGGINTSAVPMVQAAASTGFAYNSSSGSGFGSGEVWVGETAMAWHSGGNGTTNTFLSGPWYIAQLGMLAPTHTVQCRQTLIGGYYELIDKWSKQPNPDYWTALLWKRTMGRGVLAATVEPSAGEDVLIYAHCAAPWSGGTGVAIAFVNLNNETAYELDISGLGLGLGLDVEDEPSAAGSSQTRTRSGSSPVPRLEYHLSPNGPEASQSILLNGQLLSYAGPTGGLSPTVPVTISDPSTPLVIQPHTYGFVVFPQATAQGCGA